MGLRTAIQRGKRMETEKRRDQWRRYRKKRHERLKAKGLCTRCGAVARPGKAYCQECADYFKDTRFFYQSLGYCPICHENKIYGMEKECPECRAKKSIASYKSQIKARSEGKYYASQDCKNEWNRERYKRLKSEGICVRCGKRPAEPNKSRCSICLAESAEWSRRYRENLERAEA